MQWRASTFYFLSFLKGQHALHLISKMNLIKEIARVTLTALSAKLPYSIIDFSAKVRNMILIEMKAPKLYIQCKVAGINRL